MPAKVKYDKVIVFGATGSVGSIVAQTAQKYGSHVTLAVRDVSKPIRGLEADEEKEGNYTRVQADLSKPDTVKAAVQKSGATAAFVYLVWRSEDHMKSAFQALKDGGIEFVVFLSSWTVPDKAKQKENADPSNFIRFVHTKAELALEQIFDDKSRVCLRPAYFATNVLRQTNGIIANSVKVFRSDVPFDYITPIDMGQVGGNVLSKGQRDGQSVVYLCGPEMLPQREAFLKVGKGLDKEIQVNEATEEEAVEMFMATGAPEAMAKNMVAELAGQKQGEAFWSDKKHKDYAENVEKYSARVGTRLEDWVKDNADLFSSKIEDVATAMPESAPEKDEVLPEDVVPEPEEGEEGEEGEKKAEEEADKKEAEGKE